MRRIRIWDPDVVYHISNRTQEAKYLFVPDDEFNKLVHRWLKRAVRIFEVELYAAVVMSNHFHLLVRAPLMNISKFMQYFQTNLSRAVNKLRKRYDAAVFPRRFAAEPVLDEASFDRLLAYVLCNPVTANLVEQPEQYPGLTTYAQSIGVRDDGFEITVPPHWRDVDETDLAERYEQLVEPTVSDCAKRRRKSVVGPAGVTMTRWWTRPRRPKRGPRAFCHGAKKLTRKRYTTYANQVQTRYRACVLAWRNGKVTTFPYGTIPPGWTECVCRARRPRMPRHLRIAA